MKKHLTNEEKRALQHLAQQLPVFLDNTHEKRIIAGSEILSWGTVAEIDGQPIDPDKKYVWNYPVQLYNNHYRRMKKAYLKHGTPGISKYLDSLIAKKRVIELHNAMEAAKLLQKYVA